MIVVEIKRDTNKCIVEYEISGHAGFDLHGKDIVCSAVSVLAQATIIGLAEVAGIDVEVSIDKDGGGLLCIIPPLDIANREKADLLLETMYSSLESIQNSYPGNITLMEEEV